MSELQINHIHQHQHALGESPYWHPIEKKVYWVDIKNHQIFCYEPVKQQFQSWQLPGIIGGLAGIQTGGLIIGFEDKIARFDTNTSTLSILFDTKTGIRMNDGYVDPAGRFWIGQADDSTSNAKLYCYESNGNCRIMEENLTISNGLDWDLKQSRFYLIDTLVKAIYLYDYEQKTGMINNRRLFLDTSSVDGYPDGMVIDSEDYLWVCFWDGSKIIRYSPEGAIDRVLQMPIQRPTKCIFGDINLQTLYVTSAASNVKSTECLPAPNGYIYSIRLDIIGVLPTLFSA